MLTTTVLGWTSKVLSVLLKVRCTTRGITGGEPMNRELSCKSKKTLIEKASKYYLKRVDIYCVIKFHGSS